LQKNSVLKIIDPGANINKYTIIIYALFPFVKFLFLSVDFQSARDYALQNVICFDNIFALEFGITLLRPIYTLK
jgi:hypothetical protein